MENRNYFPCIFTQKLNDNHIYLWESKMTVPLIWCDLWLVRDGSHVDAQDATVRQAKEKKRDLSMSVILLSIEDESVSPFIGLRYPNLIWKKACDNAQGYISFKHRLIYESVPMCSYETRREDHEVCQQVDQTGEQHGIRRTFGHRCRE